MSLLPVAPPKVGILSHPDLTRHVCPRLQDLSTTRLRRNKSFGEDEVSTSPILFDRHPLGSSRIATRLHVLFQAP